MCGICGKINFNPSIAVEEELIQRMMSVMHHRGPDDDGCLLTENVGLGHKRLAIIDLNSGKQPIANEDETVWVVFNGEIYNYLDLRAFLLKKGHSFRTETDTEVIVHLYEELGDSFLLKLRGMFAIALWDSVNNRLLIARDRVGIKPLYYCHGSGSLSFASELKAILQDNSVKRDINVAAVDTFLTFYYVPGNETLISGIKKLRPGHYLVCENGEIAVTEYWDFDFSLPHKKQSIDTYEEQLETLLSESVKLHMLSDVPVGILLSGGVDSTALLSYMVNQTDKELHSFTVGFENRDFADERYYAGIAAEKFGSTHHDITITPEDFFTFLPKYVWHMEEPVCEPPAVALYYITELAKKYVKVLISGEGGDEAFAGYQTYRNLVLLENIKRYLKMPFARKIFASLLNKRDRLRKYAYLLNTDLDAYYYSRTSTPYSFFNQIKSQLYTPEFRSRIKDNRSIHFSKIDDYDLLSKMLYIDSKSWLPDDLLLKADKMTMANSVELRVPLLDHTLLEFAASLPSEFKLKGLTTKYLLKKMFREKIPREILKRKKTGFPVPYAYWLNKEKYRKYIEEVVFDPSSFSMNFLNPNLLRKNLFNNSTSEQPKVLFSILTLELWYARFIVAK
ncbi:MAG: asparagine synthase (glutamine-hydrolyzing) [Candidatus Electrothrix sp. AW2]|nr:asparagine synthase (glutamine-hydrolyzing) [Candidatus Electrothrix gigas]